MELSYTNYAQIRINKYKDNFIEYISKSLDFSY